MNDRRQDIITDEKAPEVQRIKYQIDYYFGDTNYPRDYYIQELELADNWIPLIQIQSFFRIKKIADDLNL